MTVVPLPPPVPPMYLRFTISAAFSTLALTLLPFFLVGMMLRCLFSPLTGLFESLTAPKKRKSKKAPANAAPAKSAPMVSYSPPRSHRVPLPRYSDAQAYAKSAHLTVTPPSPVSSMSSASSISRVPSRQLSP